MEDHDAGKLVPDGYWQLNLFLDRQRQAKANSGEMVAVARRFVDARENIPTFGSDAASLLGGTQWFWYNT